MTLPDTPPSPPSSLDEALLYAAHGLRVLPIKPGDKRPPMTAWQTAATSDEDTIRSWFTGLYRTHGVGIATGATKQGPWLFVLDVDDHGNGVSGSDTLHDLITEHGALPDTVEVVTGSGGRHLYFFSPFEIRNDAGKKLGPGLDIRGEGGQVVAPPSIHPDTGRRYEWLHDHAIYNHPIVDAPEWLLDLLATAEPDKPATPEPKVVDDFLRGDSVADRYNASVEWEDLLARDGFTFSHADQSGEQYWSRPGKTPREGTSVTVGYKGQPILKVFTSSIPWLPEGTYSKFQYLSIRDHGGDMKAAARALIAEERGTLPEEGPDAPEEGEETSWEDRDLTGWLDGTVEDVTPAILERTDGQALLYPGRINMIFGESGSGKSWVALTAAVQLISQHRHVAYIDLEDHPKTMIRRLLALGAKPGDVARYFHYKQPHIASIHYAVTAMQELVDSVDAELVIVDSYGEALALFGIDQNDDHGVAKFTQAILRPWTRMGVAVALLDHIPKSEDGPRLFAIGSQRKRAAVDGAAFRINQVKAFGKGVDGKITVVCAKDRGGTYPLGATVAEIDVHSTPDGGQVRLVVHPPEARDEMGRPMRPTNLMEKVSRFLEGEVEPATKDKIRKAVKGKGVFVDQAVDVLVAEGYAEAVEKTLANRQTRLVFASLTPFRQAEDAENGLSYFTVVPVVPQSSPTSGRLSEDPERDSRPSRPAYIQIGGTGTTDSGLGEPQSSHSRPETDSLDDLLF